MDRAARGPRATSVAGERADVGASLSHLLPRLLEAADEVARRLEGGATLRPTGVGIGAVDAAHIVVEFIHPVITGKRALPARALAPDAVDSIRPGSVVVGLRNSDHDGVSETIRRAVERGCSTLELGRADLAPTDAAHSLVVNTDDPLVARELHVTLYHLLWELVHEYLDARGSADHAAQGFEELYPFLGDQDHSDGLTTSLTATTTAKVAEIAELREAVAAHASGQLAEASGSIVACRERAGTVWTFGNGGSSTDAQALAQLLSTPHLAGASCDACALTDDVATVSALANDVSFDVVFARMLRSLARPGDVAVGLSTSGGSRNVLTGLEAAAELGLSTVGFAGYDGGAMADLDGLDQLFVVPSSSVHRIQEAQTTLAHTLIERARSS